MVKFKIGYEAEVPVRTLFVYDKMEANELARLIDTYGANMLWLEYSDEDYWSINYDSIPLPTHNIVVVCKSNQCVKRALIEGLTPILDVEAFDDIKYTPYAVRIKHKDKVLFVFLGATAIRPIQKLYKLDREVN